jgi:hypothetical protein
MALVAVPSHRLQTIHGFGAPSFASISGAGGPSHLQASFNSQPNVSYTTSRARGAPLSILAARTAAASAAQAPPTPVVTRPRRPSFRSVPIPVSPMNSRTPSASQERAADSAGYPSSRAASRFASTAPAPKMIVLSYASYSYPTVSLPKMTDDQRTAKLVASVLLSRTNGRPMRRRAPSTGEQRPYVKSCLSKAVEPEC